MGKSQRTKGHNWEREVARQLRHYFPKAHRGLQYQDGRYAADVEGTPFRIECSAGTQAVKAKWAQVTRDSTESKDTRPRVVIKKWDNIKPVVLIDFEFFKETICKLYKENN